MSQRFHKKDRVQANRKGSWNLNTKFNFLMTRLIKRLWFRTAVFSLVGLLTALASVFMPAGFTPDFGTKIGVDAVDNILGILAASMLTVTTFSLSIMVNA